MTDLITSSFDHQFDEALLDFVHPEETGYSEDVSKHDGIEAFADAGFIDFPSELYVDPKDYDKFAEERDATKTWALDFSNRFTNQSPTHECTTHAFIQGFECTYNMQLGGLFYPVWVSPLSLYSEANPRVRGGAIVKEIARIALRRGVLPEYNGPNGQGTQRQFFKHTLNCSAGNSDRDGGPWVALRNFPEGWESTAACFMPDKIINIRYWEEHMSLLFRGYCVPNGRSGHSIPHMRAVKQGGNWYSCYKDSYDILRYDSIRNVRNGVGSAYCIMSVKRPVAPDRPCGDLMAKPLSYVLNEEKRIQLAMAKGANRFELIA